MSYETAEAVDRLTRAVLILADVHNRANLVYGSSTHERVTKDIATLIVDVKEAWYNPA